MNYTYYIWITLIPLLISYTLIPINKKLGYKFKLFDNPNKRKMHKTPTVRIGGLSIGISFFTTLYFVIPNNFLYKFSFDNYVPVIIAIFFMFLLGVIDDAFNLTSIKRLLIQSLIAGYIYFCSSDFRLFINMPFFPEIQNLALFSQILNLILNIFLIVGFTNAFNWIDGLDGQACGYSILALLGFIAIYTSLEPTSSLVFVLILLGSCLPFMIFNFHPAKIFMGDGGSYLLGITIALIGIRTHNLLLEEFSSITSLVVPFLILFLPFLDMFRVIVNRIITGRSPFYPDRGHIHHRLLKKGVSYQKAVLTFYLLSIWFISIALLIFMREVGIIYFAISCFLNLVFLSKNPKIKNFIFLNYFNFKEI